jgi:hypothetical protein
MKEFKDYEGVICKNRTELSVLTISLRENGYNVCPKMKRPKYSHLIFLEGWFYDAEEWTIKFPITKEEFLERVNS